MEGRMRDPRRHGLQGRLRLPPSLSRELRHTFASLLVALGEDPRYVMGQLGHTDPAVTLRLYTHTMRRVDDERTRLRALVDGLEWAPAGTSLKIERQRATQTQRRRKQKTPPTQGFPPARPAGFEPAASCSGGKRSIH
jgi:hypothetical protein